MKPIGLEYYFSAPYMDQAVTQSLSSAILALYNISYDTIELSAPPKKELGDYAFACFPLAKLSKKSPQLIAEELSAYFQTHPDTGISQSSPAGPYLNIAISRTKASFLEALKKLSQQQVQAGDHTKETIIIDYIGANVGKPLHIGHMCTPIQGQSMINAYTYLGYNVISDSHIGDWGIIFGKLILAYKKWGDEKKLQDNAVDYLLELYVKISSESKEDSKLEEEAREAFKLLSQGDTESSRLWAMFTNESIDAMNIQLSRLHIQPQYNIGESFYEGIGLPKREAYPELIHDMHSIVDELIDAGIATQNEDHSVGVEFSEETGLSSCVLQKRNGTHGYLASDLACIKYRMQNWAPEKIIYFVDVRQKLHFQQVFQIARSAGWLKRESKEETKLIHAYNGFISGKDGAFSTRSGNIIKLSDLLDETESRAEKIIREKRETISNAELKDLKRIIGIGAIKYGYIKKKRTTDSIFDWDEFMSFDGDSGPYLQYAYVRAGKILELSPQDIAIDTSNTQEYPQQQSLAIAGKFIEKLMKFSHPDGVLAEAIDENMPHLIANYSYELTRSFSEFYDKVHIASEQDLTMKHSFLFLVEQYRKTLENCFSILGIELPSQM